MRLFAQKKTPLQLFREQKKYPFEAVFAIHGKVYHAFADINNQPSGRTLAALPLYTQLRSNCDKDYLTLFVAGLEAILSDPAKISIEKIIKLKNQLKDRLSWSYTPDMVYKYASVVYFDENENPETYDEKYNNEVKIPFWKQHLTVRDFFLTEPLQKLIPALNVAGEYFPTYLETLLKAQNLQLEVLLDILYSSRISPEENQNLNSAITALRQLYSSDNYPLTNTSSSSTEKLNILNN